MKHSYLAIAGLLCGSLTAFAGSAGEIQSKINEVGVIQVAVDADQGIAYVKKSSDGNVDMIDVKTGEFKGQVSADTISHAAVKFEVTPVMENGVLKFVSNDRVFTDEAEPMIETTPSSDEKLKSTPGMAAGLTAGLLSGIGFAFRQYFDNGWGYHFGFAGYGNKTSVAADIGMEVLRVLDETSKARFYALAGTSIYYSRNQIFIPTEPTTPYDPNNPKSQGPQDGTYTYENSMMYNFGVGIGLEWSPGMLNQKGVAFAIELPLSVTFNQTDRQGLAFDSVLPIPSASIIYYFKR